MGLGSLAYGIGTGGACLTIAQIFVLLLQHRVDPGDYPTIDPLMAGVIAGVGVGGGFAWYRSRGLENVWQRGVIAALAAIGALLVGFVAAPIDHFFGLGGMLAWVAAGVAFGVAGSRWATRGSGA